MSKRFVAMETKIHIYRFPHPCYIHYICIYESISSFYNNILYKFFLNSLIVYVVLIINVNKQALENIININRDYDLAIGSLPFFGLKTVQFLVIDNFKIWLATF